MPPIHFIIFFFFVLHNFVFVGNKLIFDDDENSLKYENNNQKSVAFNRDLSICHAIVRQIGFIAFISSSEWQWIEMLGKLRSVYRQRDVDNN